jgi:hypothetical protein
MDVNKKDKLKSLKQLKKIKKIKEIYNNVNIIKNITVNHKHILINFINHNNEIKMKYTVKKKLLYCAINEMIKFYNVNKFSENYNIINKLIINYIDSIRNNNNNELIINYIAKDTNDTPLILACKHNFCVNSIIDKLIELPNISLNHLNNENKTALYYTAKNLNYELTKKLLSQSIKKINIDNFCNTFCSLFSDFFENSYHNIRCIHLCPKKKDLYVKIFIAFIEYFNYIHDVNHNYDIKFIENMENIITDKLFSINIITDKLFSIKINKIDKNIITNIRKIINTVYLNRIIIKDVINECNDEINCPITWYPLENNKTVKLSDNYFYSFDGITEMKKHKVKISPITRNDFNDSDFKIMKKIVDNKSLTI